MTEEQKTESAVEEPKLEPGEKVVKVTPDKYEPHDNVPQQLDGQPEAPNKELAPNRWIYLPALLADEYGIATRIASEEIQLGQGVEISDTPDGPVTKVSVRDDVRVQNSVIAGKWITVLGRRRHFRFFYKGE